MSELVNQQDALNTLKAFNNAVVTTRLYPAKAPQAANAVERGYKIIKQFVRQGADFIVSLNNGEPELCGEAVQTELLQSISNLIVYRQLALMGLDILTITPELDRVVFKKILDIFTTTIENINKQGGGRQVVTDLGLSAHFPEDRSQIFPTTMGEDDEKGELQEEGLSEVRREFIELLLGRIDDPRLSAELRQLFQDPAQGTNIFSAAVSAVVEDMHCKLLYAPSPPLAQILENCSRLSSAELQQKISQDSASLLLATLDTSRLVQLFAQDMPLKLGSMLKASLLQQVSMDIFGEITKEMREKIALFRLTQGEDSPQIKHLDHSLETLLSTGKGKQYLGQEKAKAILEAGEKARQTKRVEAGLKALIAGNFEVLQSEEFSLHMPFALQEMEAEGKDSELNLILSLFPKHYYEVKGDEQTMVIKAITQISENLMLAERWDLLKPLADPMKHWIRESNEGDFIYEKSCSVLQTLCTQCWSDGDYKLGDSILSIFYQIRSGSIYKPKPVKSIIGRAQDKGLDRKVLNELLKQCLERPADESLSRRLILQGPIVSRFLVDSLIQAGNTQDRIKIIDLLTYGEQFLPPILIEKLSENMPWYGKRNLLKLLSETGSPDDLEQIYTFLHHDDLRVQREAFICIYKISGSNRKTALLRALAEAGETMKLQVVRALVPFGDSEVAAGLSQLLKEYNYYSVEFRDTLLTNVCLALSRCPAQVAEKELSSFLELRNKRGGRKIGEKVWTAAENALRYLYESQRGEKKKQVAASKKRKDAITQVKTVTKSVSEKKSITGLTEEAAIRELLHNDDTNRAKRLLLDLIAKMARLRRFTQAEQLREWLIEVDSMALSDIIKAAEIIEEEKQAAVDKGHLEIWSDLFDVLSTEEFSAFYHSLRHKRYENEEVIAKKGDIQSSLFFINSGKVKLYYREQAREVLVKSLSKGEVLGVGTFFDPSVWTINAAALGQVNLSILTFDKVRQWQEEHPALESKLRDFCSKFDSVDDFFNTSGQDRREYERYRIKPIRVTTALLDDRGQSTGINAKGELSDLSRGGVSLFMRISKRENARLLLGRMVKLILPLEETGGQQIEFSGVVVAVRGQHVTEFEYSVHLEFEQPLDGGEIKNIIHML